jgi:hypothetical protein
VSETNGYGRTSKTQSDGDFGTHVWYWRRFLGERKGQRCRLWVRSSSNGNVGIEFEDGYRTVAPRYAVRKLVAQTRPTIFDEDAA